MSSWIIHENHLYPFLQPWLDRFNKALSRFLCLASMPERGEDWRSPPPWAWQGCTRHWRQHRGKIEFTGCTVTRCAWDSKTKRVGLLKQSCDLISKLKQLQKDFNDNLLIFSTCIFLYTWYPYWETISYIRIWNAVCFLGCNKNIQHVIHNTWHKIVSQ